MWYKNIAGRFFGLVAKVWNGVSPPSNSSTCVKIIRKVIKV